MSGPAAVTPIGASRPGPVRAHRARTHAGSGPPAPIPSVSFSATTVGSPPSDPAAAGSCSGARALAKRSAKVGHAPSGTSSIGRSVPATQLGSGPAGRGAAGLEPSRRPRTRWGRPGCGSGATRRRNVDRPGRGATSTIASRSAGSSARAAATATMARPVPPASSMSRSSTRRSAPPARSTTTTTTGHRGSGALLDRRTSTSAASAASSRSALGRVRRHGRVGSTRVERGPSNVGEVATPAVEPWRQCRAEHHGERGVGRSHRGGGLQDQRGDERTGHRSGAGDAESSGGRRDRRRRARRRAWRHLRRARGPRLGARARRCALAPRRSASRPFPRPSRRRGAPGQPHSLRRFDQSVGALSTTRRSRVTRSGAAR